MAYGQEDLNSPGFGDTRATKNTRRAKPLDELAELQDDDLMDLPSLAPLGGVSLNRRRSSRLSKNNNFDNYFRSGPSMNMNPF